MSEIFTPKLDSEEMSELIEVLLKKQQAHEAKAASYRERVKTLREQLAAAAPPPPASLQTSETSDGRTPKGENKKRIIAYLESRHSATMSQIAKDLDMHFSSVSVVLKAKGSKFHRFDDQWVYDSSGLI